MGRVNVEIGDEYGILTVVAELPIVTHGSRRIRVFQCQCECGKLTDVRLYNLRSGGVVSCGCAHFKYKNGEHKSSTYRSWDMMKQRCLNPKDPAYHNYGGRGIKVCERWLQFKTFLEDMGERPSLEHSIDRYPDTNGPYAPGNCRWATRAEQNRNKRDNVLLTFNGETRCAADWADSVGINRSTFLHRLSRGYSIEEALTIRVGTRRVVR